MATEWRSRTIEKCSDGSGLYRVEYYTNGLFVRLCAPLEARETQVPAGAGR